MTPGAPITPKEFAADVFGGKVSARWVRAQCHRWVESGGSEGIAVITPKRPYLIPATERARLTLPHVFQRAITRQ